MAATVRQAPHCVPPVFADGRVIVYGLGEGPPPATAVLRARGPAGEVEWHLPLDSPAAGAFLRELFALGARLPWNETLARITGERLNARYFVEEFVDAG